MVSARSVAVIGAGNIGGTLARCWAAAGRDVRLGVRDPATAEKRGLPGRIGPALQVIEGAEVVVFAVPGPAVPETAQSIGDRLDGKVVVDATNNVGADVMNNVGVLAAAAPRARIYRAFNSLGWENFADPVFGQDRADLFFCGPDGDGKATVEALIGDVGLRPVYVGGIDRAGVVDGVTALWFALAYGRGLGREIAFKLLTR